MDILISWLCAIFIGLPIGLLIIKIGSKFDGFISKEELDQKLSDYFGDRPKLSDEDFYVEYFKAQGIPKEIPIRVREIFEDHFDADFSQIKNTDDFSEEMKFIWGFDSMIDVEIAVAISEEFDLPKEVEFEKVKSIQDIVSMVWKYKQK